MTFLIPNASQGKIELTFLGSASDSNANNSIQNNINYGVADPTLVIVVVTLATIGASGGLGGVGSVTIPGQSGGVNIFRNLTDGSIMFGMAAARVPSGTSGNIAVQFNTSGTISVASKWFSVYRLTGLTTNVPFSVVGRSDLIDIPAGGVGIGGAWGSGTSWSGATEDDQTGQLSVASISTDDELIQYDMGATGSGPGGLCSWQPG